MLVLTANRPDMKLGTNDRLVVNMGAAHKNQAYRPLLLSKSTGLATYLKDSDVPAGLVRYTDNQGNLTFTQMISLVIQPLKFQVIWQFGCQ